MRANAATALVTQPMQPEGQPAMSVITGPWTPQLPEADSLAEIEDADMLHETACDVYDIATRELDAARDALTEAARRLATAEDDWSLAGAAMNDAARHVAGLRQAAGVVRTADGYRPVSA